MQAVSTYIMGITAVALIGGILTKLSGQKQGSGKLLPVLCSVFLTLTILRPLSNLDGKAISWDTFDFSSRAEEISLQGQNMTRDTLRKVITENAEAYILNKAKEMGLQITATISLSQDDVPVPASVQLTGAASPLEKKQLTSIITEDLGIPKEDQKWSR